MKIKSILLSQPKPADVAKTPYEAIIKKFNVNIEFEKFIKLEEVSASDFPSLHSINSPLKLHEV